MNRYAVFTTSLYILPFAVMAAPFEDATQGTIGVTTGWSNKVELADINGDGAVDLIFANGGNYASAGAPELNSVFLNNSPQAFTSVGSAIFDTGDLARAIKIRDLNNDGVVDIIVATTYQTQSRLFLGLGGGDFVEVTTTHLPQDVGSFGDVALGDVDGDGDIDLVFADWGPGNPLNNDGGVTRLWLNNGFGAFADATTERMPDVRVGFSWELELVDVDNDWDLDILVSCKSCTGSKLFHNDGEGNFIDASEALPQFANNYDFEAMDINGDGLLDLVTVNDGPGLREHILLADGLGGFVDSTDTLWPDDANIGEDDNMVVFLDYDSDGDADFLIGSLSGQDRLLLNDGQGNLSLQTEIFAAPNTPGTLGIAVADLNGDARLDVVHSQGEVTSPEKVFFGVDIPPDTAPPTISLSSAVPNNRGGLRIRARIHDRKSPVMPHDFDTIEVIWTSGDSDDANNAPMQWMGEYLFWADVNPPNTSILTWQICATDRAGNSTCSTKDTVDRTGDSTPVQPDNDLGTYDASAISDDASAGSDANTVRAEASEVAADIGAGTDDTSDMGTPADRAPTSAEQASGGCYACARNSSNSHIPYVMLLVMCVALLNYRCRAGSTSID